MATVETFEEINKTTSSAIYQIARSRKFPNIEPFVQSSTLKEEFTYNYTSAKSSLFRQLKPKFSLFKFDPVIKQNADGTKTYELPPRFLEFYNPTPYLKNMLLYYKENTNILSNISKDTLYVGYVKDINDTVDIPQIFQDIIAQYLMFHNSDYNREGEERLPKYALNLNKLMIQAQNNLI